jgi:hypothetical protein
MNRIESPGGQRAFSREKPTPPCPHPLRPVTADCRMAAQHTHRTAA